MKKNPDGSEELSSTIYQGYILPPDMLKEFKEIDSEFPERIIKLAEEESLRRHSYEIKCLKEDLILHISSLVCSILATVSILFVAYLFMQRGFASEGMWIALSTAGVVGIFIVKKYMAENSMNSQQPK